MFTLLVVGVVFAALVLFPKHHEIERDPAEQIDAIIAHPESRAEKAVISALIARDSIVENYVEPGGDTMLGLVSVRDDSRTLLVYWSIAERPGNDRHMAHSIQLIDRKARTSSWLLLDPKKMDDYFHAVQTLKPEPVFEPRGN